MRHYCFAVATLSQEHVFVRTAMKGPVLCDRIARIARCVIVFVHKFSTFLAFSKTIRLPHDRTESLALQTLHKIA